MPEGFVTTYKVARPLWLHTLRLRLSMMIELHITVKPTSKFKETV